MNDNTIKVKKPSKLIKDISRSLKAIRKNYKIALKKDNKNKAEEWLCDNYYIFNKEGNIVLKDLKMLKKQPLSQNSISMMYDICEKMCSNAGLPTQDVIEETMLQNKPTVPELELLPTILRAVIIKSVSNLEAIDSEEVTDIYAKAVTSLRLISDIDFEGIVENVSEVEKYLSQDPTGDYPKMDDKTKAKYRHCVAVQALEQNVSEQRFAQDILIKAKNQNQHIGAFLTINKDNTKKGKVLLALHTILPLIICIITGVFLRSWYVPLLIYLPIKSACITVLDFLFMNKVKPRFVPKLKVDSVDKENAAALVVVSTLLPTGEKVEKLKNRLIELKRSNGNSNTKFCVLADYKSSSVQTEPEDEQNKEILKKMIDEINSQCDGGFILALRARSYSETQKEYVGWERKRGAITQLMRAINGIDNQFELLYGDIGDITKVKYVMALDSDTNLPFDTVDELVAVAEHPLNKPTIDELKGRVTTGYGILAPKIEIDVKSAFKTGFSRAMSGIGGITAYVDSCSDLYQDFFDEGIFAGKGLINVEMYNKLLDVMFPKEVVLSHDILEGGYLKVGFVSDIQVTDSFPSKQNSFFDRLHRWVRGDWQNFRFMFGSFPKNCLNWLSRYKLLENLRRSLTPVISVLAILLSFLMPTPQLNTVILTVLFATMFPHFFSGFYSLIAGGLSKISRLYYSDVTPTAEHCLVGGVIEVVMLVQNAWVCFNAICKSIFRQIITKRKLLEWVTAADSEKAQKPIGFLVRYFPTIVVSALLLWFGEPIQKMLGLIFICDLPFAWFTVKSPKTSYDSLSEEDIKMLKDYARKMWRYYEELCTEDENFLPPDNFQETPVHRVAHRTSPTNIGYMLLCTLCAKDFGFIDVKTMCDRIEKSIETVESLEKWNGNLINWYDTKTKRPLHPRFVSTVDSGNFVCSLVALRQGLKEIISEDARVPVLIDKITQLIDDCDLSVFYNKRRKLFYIGFDMEEQKFANSYYDLLMSEARMTSFYAIASRQVPKEHWAALSRLLATDSRYAGPISWTGTMFEYYMPNILLPVFKNTISYEALRFCSWCQKKRVKGKKIPWGISESGFYSFDTQLNYQYKAHGVQKLGLKRDLNSDLVVSPYSTFLVLPYEPKSAIKNLKVLKDMQLTGRCGFYEAVDFTPERLEGKEYAIVRSYMAHHVGMSLLNIENLLNKNIMQKRFMSDEKMAGAVSLLQERIPTESLIFHDFDIEDPPQIRTHVEPQIKEYDKINPYTPNVKVYSNGEWSLSICDNGASISRYRGVDIVRTSNDLLKNPMGIFAFVRNKDMTLPITKCIDYNSNAEFTATYYDTYASLQSSMNDISCSMDALVYPHLPCEERRITIKNNSKLSFEGELIIYFEPSLSLFKEESQHPAFSKLFLQNDYDEKNKILLFSRNTRSKKQPLCLAAGFLEDFEYDYGVSREDVLKRPFGINSLIESQIPTTKCGVPDLCAVFKIPIKIAPKQKETKRLILCVSTTMDEAIERFKIAKTRKEFNLEKASSSPFKEDMIDGVIAWAVLPHILFPQIKDKESIKAKAENELSKKGIWRFGISGDNPIIFINASSVSDIEKVAPYVRLVSKLRKCGIIVDLAIACKVTETLKEEFGKKMQEMITKETKSQTAGIFLVDELSHDEGVITTLKAIAVYIVPKNEHIFIPQPNYKPFKECEGGSLIVERGNRLDVKGGFFTPGVFTITTKPKLPWCVVLANPSFGTLVSDMSLGFSWALNSRENKLTPWSNDTMTDSCGEKLYLKINGKAYNLVLGATVRYSKKIVQYLGTVEGVKYDITVWVPEKGMIKHCDVKLENSQEVDKNLELVYYTEPIMGVNNTNSRLLKFDFDGKSLIVNNKCTFGPYGYMRVGMNKDVDFFTCNRAEFLNGKWESNSLESTDNNCCAIGKKIILPPKRKELVRFILSWGASEVSSEVVTKAKLDVNLDDNKMYVCTPDKELNYLFNTWLPAQILNSRIWGRTGFYQCGGAYGFRDQLQDVSSQVLLNPKLVRTHIFRCCAHQFQQGDVLHWWHTLPESIGGTKGVRTRYSDDLLWLPFVACEYALKTGDYEIFNIKVPYLEAQELSEMEQEKYLDVKKSKTKATVYEHCIKAIERAFKFGDHGLALIGGGDWNDGFNDVGKRGRGESVWLSQFLSMVLTEFASIAKQMQEEQRAEEYLKLAEKLKEAIDEKAWNGDWYLRAFYDDGTPMGVKGADQCEIDSLSQSFAVLSDMPNQKRKDKALKNAIEKLVDEENGIIKLFTPAFKINGKKAGYVNAYPQGIRENSGQYTHASVWLCNALIKNGQQDEGYKLLRMINPIVKYTDDQMAKKYQTEAYALTGDVYSNHKVPGRGGWSLYTGAASWYYRTIYEELLGIKQRDNCLYFEPKLPSSWSGYNMRITIDEVKINIEVKRQENAGLIVDGKSANCVKLDGENHVVVCMIN